MNSQKRSKTEFEIVDLKDERAKSRLLSVLPRMERRHSMSDFVSKRER